MLRDGTTMKIAIISDIHSNLPALQRALEEIDTLGVNEILCLGDVVGYGANPNECISLVQKRCAGILQGNHDAAAVDLSVASFFTTHARVAAEWTHRHLSREGTAFLKELPLTTERNGLFFVHASPLEPSEWNYVLDIGEVRRALEAFPGEVCFIGHSHIPGVFSYRGAEEEVRRGERYIINVGSVGQPRDGDPRLSFGIFDIAEWRYDNYRVEYDVEQARKNILEVGLPRILGDRLRSGL
jgi:diadenosine tetraphosphatase ApaH/serine/threonine PP2A family protein phosphatase